MTYRYRLAAVFLMGFFVDCINIFMPAIALPTIAAEFHVGVSAGAWVANAYMLGLTLAIPVSTWLAGRWGARRLMAGSMLAFALAVWACGLAGTFGQLIGWRFVQGMAGGLMIPVGQAAAFNLFQGPERARISTLVMAVALIAPALAVAGRADRGSWVLALDLPFEHSAGAGRRGWPGAGCATPRPSVRRVRTSRGWR